MQFEVVFVEGDGHLGLLQRGSVLLPQEYLGEFLFGEHAIIYYTAATVLLLFMENVDMAKDLEKILKEGFLEKESRHLKTWRKYHTVNQDAGLYSPPTHSTPSRSEKYTVTPRKSCL